jgi:hypothetical protein
MTTYLTIITTALVLTQVIRLIQNSIQLKRLGNTENQLQKDISQMCDDVHYITILLQRNEEE